MIFETLKKLYFKYKSIILYLFFGVCTTAVNVAAYSLFYYTFSVQNIPSTIFAWFLAVYFAFFTNKLFVFESKNMIAIVFLYEMFMFFLCRVLTGVLEVLIMYFAVDRMHWHATLWKLVTNFIVIVLNFIASKFIIFIKGDKHNGNNFDRTGE